MESLFANLFGRHLSPLTDSKTGTLWDRILDALDDAPDGELNEVSHGPSGYVSWLSAALGETEKTIRSNLRRMEIERLLTVHRVYDKVGKHVRYSITAHQQTADYFDQKALRAWPVGRKYQQAFLAKQKETEQ